ncbi:hypothetical protein ACJX0J_028704, partial [Zea mays]
WLYQSAKNCGKHRNRYATSGMILKAPLQILLHKHYSIPTYHYPNRISKRLQKLSVGVLSLPGDFSTRWYYQGMTVNDPSRVTNKQISDENMQYLRRLYVSEDKEDEENSIEKK